MNGAEDGYERSASSDMQMFLRWTRTFKEQMDDRNTRLERSINDLRTDLRERIDGLTNAQTQTMNEFRDRLERVEETTLDLKVKNAARVDLGWLYKGLAILVLGTFLAAIASLFHLGISQEASAPGVSQGRHL